ncbi:ATP-binding protein [Streptomyces sp. NPDC047097]|uniref:ATP-binding protein n=1 Tax=Streptomyces sp. NPDC047097 TaxID=3155260 RepID=UPI0033DE5602
MCRQGPVAGRNGRGRGKGSAAPPASGPPGPCPAPPPPPRTSSRPRAAVPDPLPAAVAAILTELLANAVRHGIPPLRATLTVRIPAGGRPVLRVEVADRGPGPDPARVRARWRHPSYDVATGGRGLVVVDALAADWGVVPGPTGHTVWAELPLPDTGPEPADHASRPADPDQSGDAPAPNHR